MPRNIATGPRIETGRLLLRAPQAADFDGWAALFNDPEATRFLGGPRARSMAWQHFLAMAGGWRIQGASAFSIVDKHSGQWLGWTGPWHPEGWNGPELGWCLQRQAWGCGFATEAAAAARDWIFGNLGWPCIIHNIAPDNVASKAVARRLGSKLLRHEHLPEPFEGEAVEVWGQSLEDWKVPGR